MRFSLAIIINSKCVKYRVLILLYEEVECFIEMGNIGFEYARSKTNLDLIPPQEIIMDLCVLIKIMNNTIINNNMIRDTSYVYNSYKFKKHLVKQIIIKHIDIIIILFSLLLL